MTPVKSAFVLAPLLACALAGSASAQDVPTVDTEDVGLGSLAVGSGRLHPSFSFDVRNGDFARGNYDDDAADLDRVPVHLQFGLGYELVRDASEKPKAWLLLSSSNGLHSPIAAERASPRAWYESNNLVALVVEPADGFRAGLVYTIKTSPNGISSTTHEASVTTSYEAETGIGWLQPSLSATIRPKGDGGVYTMAGISPSFDLGSGDNAPSLSVSAQLGVGWGGFYQSGSGDRVFGNVGLAYSHPFDLGDTKWRFRAEGLALIRDDRLRRLSGPLGETDTVVPLATISLAVAY